MKLKKDELSVLEKTQIMYLAVIHSLVEKGLNYFSLKLQKKAVDLLRQVIHLG